MLNINEYNYPLTDDRIAKYPLSQRDCSKLLIYQHGQISESRFFHIGDYLPNNALLVYNNTRVIQARLVFHKPTGARIEVFCLEPIAPKDYALNLSSMNGCTWKCMVGNLKKWKEGILELTIPHDSIPQAEHDLHFYAEKQDTNGNTHTIHFSWDNRQISFAEILECCGELPIPPYLNRPTEESDKTTYQTVYSRIKGSVAAPTAGLHFTDTVLNELRSRGIQTTELTLHVGAGTFQPVKNEDANEHLMHTEIIAVPKKTIIDVLSNLGHVVAVGTTSVRTLESLYYIGLRFQHKDNWSDDIHINQFEPYRQLNALSPAEALQNILAYLDYTKQDTLHAETQIMIKPGFQYRIVNHIITNFHQPKSTLLLLVSAFVGEAWKDIYKYALEHNFRFLSYGDSSILSPKEL